MAIIHACDYPETEPHVSTRVVTATVGRTAFAGEFCDGHAEIIVRTLTHMGLKPTKAQVGHSRRGAYITASGRDFTAREARNWLREAGHQVAEAGKLSTEQLGMYAANH